MNLNDFPWSTMIVKVIAAIIIFVVTAIVAKFLKRVLTKQLARIRVLDRQSGSGDTLAASLGSIASLVIWLFGLMAILNLFELTQVLTPMQGLLTGILAALPNIIGAGLVLFIGVVLAKIVRELVITALQAANVDRHLAKLGGRFDSELAETAAAPTGLAGAGASAAEAPGAGRTAAGRQGFQLSVMLGQLLFSVIVLIVGISALQILGIKAISEPATHMLTLILDAIPLVIGAGILLAIGVVIARVAGNLVQTLLSGLNTDAAFERLGLEKGKLNLPALAARVTEIAIVLFFAIAATQMLNFPQLTDMLNTVLALAGKVLFGAVVIAAGVFIANLLRSFVDGQAGTIIYYVTIVLCVAMGLKYMGLADSIVNLAFGALVVGGAAAAALAFGLGGRDAAARQLSRMQNSGRSNSSYSAGPAGSASPASTYSSGSAAPTGDRNLDG